MPPNVFPTTAEGVIAVTDAVLLKEVGCDTNFVSQFLDWPINNAHNALEMARELGLIKHDSASGYQPCKPYTIYLVTARDIQKAAVLRLVLEHYEPFKLFKSRLGILEHVHQAADQVKNFYGMDCHREDLKDTFINLGTYAQSLASKGAGLYKISDFDTRRVYFLETITEVAADRTAAEIYIRKRLTDNVIAWIHPEEVLGHLITAYQKLDNNDSRSPVLYAGNAIESFLSQLGTHYSIGLGGAHGINAKAKALDGRLNTKHKSMMHYLGHVRNAANHGVDSQIGVSWTISQDTAIEYVHVALSTIKAVVLALYDHYVI